MMLDKVIEIQYLHSFIIAILIRCHHFASKYYCAGTVWCSDIISSPSIRSASIASAASASSINIFALTFILHWSHSSQSCQRASWLQSCKLYENIGIISQENRLSMCLLVLRCWVRCYFFFSLSTWFYKRYIVLDGMDRGLLEDGNL